VKFSKREIEELKGMLEISKSKGDFQRIQCVWLRASLSMDAATVATITNLKIGTVRTIWSNYRRLGRKSLFGIGRGGRRNSHLSVEEERAFLRPFMSKFESGNHVVIADIQVEYERLIQKKVPKSTVYRMLSRHGWKKSKGRAKNITDQNYEKANMDEYWIEGCVKSLTPEKTVNIAQHWLQATLQAMKKT